MRLYLVQHGVALAKEIDPQRPLSERGRRDVELMAGFLGNAGVQVGHLYHSGKTRAVQTADLLAARVLTDGGPERMAGLNPKDPPESFAARVRAWEEDVLAVGHLPFMSRMVSLLIAGHPTLETVAFVPGSLVCLERNADDTWTLIWMLRPEIFSALSPDTSRIEKAP